MKNLWGLLAGMLIVPVGIMAEPAKAVKNDFVRAKPFTNAQVVVALKTGQTVDISKRQGSWYLVKVGAKTGWTPMLAVRRTAAPATATSGSLSNTATGRSASGGVVSTTGVRGLDEETLAAADFSEDAIAGVEKSRVTPAQVDSFMNAGALVARPVATLSGTTTGGAQ